MKQNALSVRLKKLLHGYEHQEWIDEHIFAEHKKEWNEIFVKTDEARKIGLEIQNKFGVATVFVRKQYTKYYRGLR
jgi:hypothetical protein